jgi:hypothetical protein
MRRGLYTQREVKFLLIHVQLKLKVYEMMNDLLMIKKFHWRGLS